MDRQEHVLGGDKAGGGHRYGVIPLKVGQAKTWFPQTWSDGDIVEAVENVLAAPKIVRWVGEYDFINAYGEVRGVRIKVRVTSEGVVSTAHPVDGAGVVRVKLLKDGTVDGPVEVFYGRSGEITW